LPIARSSDPGRETKRQEHHGRCRVRQSRAGHPVIGLDGKPIPLRFPVSTSDRPLTYWIIGLNVTHIGKTIHRLLFRPGMDNSLRVIRDEITDEWRTWNKADTKDAAREDETRSAGPMIPERLIEPDSWEWESLGGHVFRRLRLTNGAIIYAFPSTGRDPAMGDAVDGIWINEDIENPNFIAEWQDRLIDRDGWFLWDAWPQTKNYALVEMLQRAAECADKQLEPDVSAFQLDTRKNIYAKDEAIDRAMRRMGDDDEIAKRALGELLLDQLSMYDFFPNIHLIKKTDRQEAGTYRNAQEFLQWLYSRDGRSLSSGPATFRSTPRTRERPS